MAYVQTTSDIGTCHDAVLDDEIVLHLYFGRRHLFFTLVAALASSSCQQTTSHIVNNVLLRNASEQEQRLPRPPICSDLVVLLLITVWIDYIIAAVIGLLRTASVSRLTAKTST